MAVRTFNLNLNQASTSIARPLQLWKRNLGHSWYLNTDLDDSENEFSDLPSTGTGVHEHRVTSTVVENIFVVNVTEPNPNTTVSEPHS